jgi:hypothetical protein
MNSLLLKYRLYIYIYIYIYMLNFSKVDSKSRTVTTVVTFGSQTAFHYTYLSVIVFIALVFYGLVLKSPYLHASRNSALSWGSPIVHGQFHHTTNTYIFLGNFSFHETEDPDLYSIKSCHHTLEIVWKSSQ